MGSGLVSVNTFIFFFFFNTQLQFLLSQVCNSGRDVPVSGVRSLCTPPTKLSHYILVFQPTKACIDSCFDS